MASLGRLTIDMVANLAGFEKDMGRAQRVTAKSMQSVRRDLRRAERDADKARESLKRLGMQMGALAAVGVGVVAREFQRISQQANNLDKTAKVVAINVEELQKLRFAAQQAAGVTSQTLDMAMQRFARRVGEAANGTGELMGIVEELGISLRDSNGNIRSQTDLLAEFADRITATTSAQEQLRIAFKLFDSEGARLLPLLNQGSQAFRDLMQQAEDTGSVISKTAVKDFVRFNDELEVLRMRASGLSVTIAEDLIGNLADFVEFLNTEEGTRRLKAILEDIAATAEVVGTMIGIRMVVQLGAYSVQLGIATAATIKHQLALAGMSKTAATTMATMRGLGIAIRGLFGPLGLAATALGVFAVSAQDSTGVLSGFNEELRDMRFETRQFANEQQLAQDIQSFRDEAKQAADQIEQLKNGLDNLGKEKQATERLRDYNERISKIPEATKLANAEIERLQQVQAEASRKADELGKEYDKLETATRETTDATEKLNDAMADDRRQQFLRDMQDLSDELEGPAAQAARAFAREIEALHELLDAGIISPQEYANFARGLVQVAQQSIDNDKVEKSFTDVAAEGIAAGIEKAFASMTAGDISTMGFSEIGGVIGRSIFGELGRGFGEMFTETFSDFGESLGKSIGDMAGEAMGDALSESFGEALGKIAGPIGEVLGRFIFDKIFPTKDPKFQVGGAIGFGATGAGRVSMDLSAATPFGDLFIRFRKITAEAQDQLRDALISFDQTIASIISDEGQMKRISDALAKWGFDTQEEGLTLERVLRSRFDAIVGTFDQFGQDMIRSGATLEEQITNMMDLINIRARMAIGDSFGGGIANNTQVYLAMDLARANESMAQSFQRLLTITGLLNKAMDLINARIPGGTAAVARFGDALQRAFGDDLQRLNTSLNTVFETFFDADEILEQTASASRERAASLLAQIGIDLTDKLLTVEGFRELFDSLFASLSPEQAAILIEAGVAISDFIGATNELSGTVEDAVESVNDMSAVLSERAGLERRLAQLTGDTEALRQMELDAVDESNRALLERIFALEDEAAAAAEAAAVANERAGLESRLYTLMGNTAALRQMELDALDPANRDLLRRIYALEDERAANQAATQSAQEAIQSQRELTEQTRRVGLAFAEAMIGVEESILMAPLNEFQTEMVGIHRQLLTTIDTINRATGSAITQAQANRALARAHEAAAVAAAAAVKRLEDSTQLLVREVFGTPLDEINRQIDLLQNNSDNVADSIKRTNEAMADLVAFADSLLTGGLSPLPSRQRLELGLDQLISASERGDVQAVQSLAQEVLRIGRERFATGPEFTALFNQVQDIIRSTIPVVEDVQAVEVVSSPELVALFEERDRLIQEQSDADRRANAQNIAQSIADISQATGESFAEVAERLGIPLDELAAILGLDYAQLNGYLSTLQVETMSLAQDLEMFARDIRDSINSLADALMNGGTSPIDSSEPEPRRPKVGPHPPGWYPHPGTTLPDPTPPMAKMGSPVLPNFGQPRPFSADKNAPNVQGKTSDQEVIENTARIARNTEALVLEMRRDQLRSSRTALA